MDAHQAAEDGLAAQGPLAAFSRSRVPELDVVPLTTLKVLTWDLVCFAVPTFRVELVWKAVRARHPGRQFHLPPPMCAAEFRTGI